MKARVNRIAKRTGRYRRWFRVVGCPRQYRARSSRAVEAHGLTPRARVQHRSCRGADPIYMPAAPVPATAYALKRSALSLADIDLIEIDEAFASVVLAW